MSNKIILLLALSLSVNLYAMEHGAGEPRLLFGYNIQRQSDFVRDAIKRPGVWDFTVGCSLLLMFRKHITWVNAGKLAVASYLGNVFVPTKAKRVVADVPVVRQMLNCQYLRAENSREPAHTDGIVHRIGRWLYGRALQVKELFTEQE